MVDGLQQLWTQRVAIERWRIDLVNIALQQREKRRQLRTYAIEEALALAREKVCHFVAVRTHLLFCRNSLLACCERDYSEPPTLNLG
jgi:hypothetical protein